MSGMIHEKTVTAEQVRAMIAAAKKDVLATMIVCIDEAMDVLRSELSPALDTPGNTDEAERETPDATMNEPMGE